MDVVVKYLEEIAVGAKDASIGENLGNMTMPIKFWVGGREA